jgi:hypothetical protein
MPRRQRPSMQLTSMSDDCSPSSNVAAAATTEQAPAQTAVQLPKPSSWVYILALCTLAIFICYADRSNISIAILEMAKQFEWDEKYQGTILSVFFVGCATILLTVTNWQLPTLQSCNATCH